MKLFIKQMNKEMANAILHWNYEEPYNFYNNEVTIEALLELLDGSYYAIVTEETELIGFFCTGENAQVSSGVLSMYKHNAIDIGFGMHPDLVGQGNGYEFCTYILNHIEESFENMPIRLTVATFNKRAIHLYEKLGFKSLEKFNSNTTKFLIMMK